MVLDDALKWGKQIGKNALKGAAGTRGIAATATIGAAIGGGVGALGSIGDGGEGFGRRTIKGALGGAAVGAMFGGGSNIYKSRGRLLPDKKTKALAVLGNGVTTNNQKFVQAGIPVKQAMNNTASRTGMGSLARRNINARRAMIAERSAPPDPTHNFQDWYRANKKTTIGQLKKLPY